MELQRQQHRATRLSYTGMLTTDNISEPGTRCVPVSSKGKYKMTNSSKLFMLSSHQNVKKMTFQVLLAISSLFIFQTGNSGRETPQGPTFNPTMRYPLHTDGRGRHGVNNIRSNNFSNCLLYHIILHTQTLVSILSSAFLIFRPSLQVPWKL